MPATASRDYRQPSESREPLIPFVLWLRFKSASFENLMYGAHAANLQPLCRATKNVVKAQAAPICPVDKILSDGNLVYAIALSVADRMETWTKWRTWAGATVKISPRAEAGSLGQDRCWMPFPETTDFYSDIWRSTPPLHFLNQGNRWRNGLQLELTFALGPYSWPLGSTGEASSHDDARSPDWASKFDGACNRKEESLRKEYFLTMKTPLSLWIEMREVKTMWQEFLLANKVNSLPSTAPSIQQRDKTKRSQIEVVPFIKKTITPGSENSVRAKVQCTHISV